MTHSHFVLGLKPAPSGESVVNTLWRRAPDGTVDALLARTAVTPVSSPHAGLGRDLFVADRKNEQGEIPVIIKVPVDAPAIDVASLPDESGRVFSPETCNVLGASSPNNLFCIGPTPGDQNGAFELRHYDAGRTPPVAGRVIFDGNHAANEGGKLTDLLAASETAAFVATAGNNEYSSVIYKVDLQGVVTVLACKVASVVDLAYFD